MLKCLSIITFLLVLLSCNSNTTVLKYSIYDYEIDRIYSKEKNLIDYKLEEDKLTYCYEDQCESYIIQNEMSKFISSGGDTSSLLLDKKVNYILNDKQYEIYRYLLGTSKIDGETQHYWSPNFGIILVKSSTWNGMRVLNKKNCPDEDVLNSLLTVLLTDESMMSTKKEKTDEKV